MAIGSLGCRSFAKIVKSAAGQPAPAVALGVAAMLAYLFLNALHRLPTETGDFCHFYQAARAMIAGEDIYASGQGGYIYPPLLALLYTPLALLSENTAAMLLLAGNTGLLLVSIWLAAREFVDRFSRHTDPYALGMVALGGILLSADKLRSELQMWQTNLLVLALYTLALRWLDRRPVLAGFALAAAFNIKYLPVVALPYLVLRRRWVPAAAFVAAVPALALLPAVRTGWHANLQNLATAYGGVARLFGLDVAGSAKANIALIQDRMSLSITSAIGRAFGWGTSPGLALAGAALLGLAGLAIVAWMYRRHGVAFWYRADGRSPDAQPGRALVALEWTALIMAALIFSPQTNSRHFSLLLLANALAVLLLRYPCGAGVRWPIAVGTAALFLGMLLPPGGVSRLALARYTWHAVSGPSWCALAMLGCLVWGGLQAALAAPRTRRSTDSARAPLAVQVTAG